MIAQNIFLDELKKAATSNLTFEVNQHGCIQHTEGANQIKYVISYNFLVFDKIQHFIPQNILKWKLSYHILNFIKK